MILFSIISSIMISAIPVYIYYSYINELKDCKCAEDYRQIYVKYAVIGVMLFSIVTSILLYYFEKSKLTKYTSGAISLSLSALLLSYAYSLIKKDCECSVSWKRTFMLVHGVLLLVPNLFIVYKSVK
jgi:divalent metal cation (Fe/Co/Zn/Cd) transporter